MFHPLCCELSYFSVLSLGESISFIHFLVLKFVATLFLMLYFLLSETEAREVTTKGDVEGQRTERGEASRCREMTMADWGDTARAQTMTSKDNDRKCVTS